MNDVLSVTHVVGACWHDVVITSRLARSNVHKPTTTVVSYTCYKWKKITHFVDYVLVKAPPVLWEGVGMFVVGT